MADSSYVQEPNNMVSDPSLSSEDVNSTCSCNIECHCEEHHQPKKNKKRRKKISHIIKYVVGFSYVKKLKITKKSHKKRRDNNNDDKVNPPPIATKIHRLNSDEYLSPKASPVHENSTSLEDVTIEPNEEESGMATSSTRRIFGAVGMHHVMLIIILAALALSGKACAILATIVWLILLSLTSRFSNIRRTRLIVRKFMTRL